MDMKKVKQPMNANQIVEKIGRQACGMIVNYKRFIYVITRVDEYVIQLVDLTIGVPVATSTGVAITDPEEFWFIENAVEYKKEYRRRYRQIKSAWGIE